MKGARSKETAAGTITTISNATSAEHDQRARLLAMLKASPIPAPELLANLGLYLTRQALSRVLFMQELYQLALPVHGIIMELGTRWGQSAALFCNLRGIYEPYNYTRKIVAFDTFAGFQGVAREDGADRILRTGAYGVTSGYQSYLSDLLQTHEQASPIAHIRKFELVAGDVSSTLPSYLQAHPETIVALAYFDMDLYKPTFDALKALKPYLTKGSVLGFDELNYAQFPGETVAVREALGLDRHPIRRSVLSPTASFIVVD